MNQTSTETATPFKTFTVGAEHVGKRLDRFLVDTIPELSRARVKEMIAAGQVRVNGRRARKGDAVSEGDTVQLLAPPPPRDFTPLAEPELPLVVRHEDDFVVVVEKPAGMPTHPLRPDETGTVANAIVARYPETMNIGFARREPGLLHRLDTDTSGLLIVARLPEAFEKLRAASRQGKIVKHYIALVEGEVVAEGRVDYPLVPHRKDPKRVEAVTPNVRLRAGTRIHPAHTRYRPVRVFRHPEMPWTYSLLEVEVHVAFRHQVRVHLATIGHPLVGDALYRGPVPPPELGLSRHFLHASKVVFPHPRTGEETVVRSPLPEDLDGFIKRLEMDMSGTVV